MSSFLCFICHSTVNKETNEETREKYREVVGMNLCPDSQLCYICCHVLNKLSLFRSICLKRSLEYPVLFREKGTINLQRSDLELHVLCPEECNQYQRSKLYQFSYSNDFNDANYNNDNEYVKLEHENNFQNYFTQCQYQNVENNDVKRDAYHCIDNMNSFVNDVSLTENNDMNADIINKSNDNSDHFEEDACDNDMFSENEHENEILNINKENVNVDIEQKLSNEELLNETIEVQHNGVNDKYMDVDTKENCDDNDVNKKVLKKEKLKKKGFKKFILSMEEQKAELEANRKEKKYIESEYKCYNCAMGFLFKDTYQAHMMRHEESNGEHQCETCTLRFSTLPLLRSHVANHKERYICSKCGLNLRPRAQRGHSCGGSGDVQKVSCHLCGNLFKDSNGLQQHIRRVHTNKSSGRLHSCGVCGDAFTTQPALRTHMIKHVKRVFRCSSCTAQFRSPYSRARHELVHEAAPSPHLCSCGASFSSRKSLVAHRRRSAKHQLALFECPICGRPCPSRAALASHAAVHGPSRPHACRACPARYPSRKSLLRHQARHPPRHAPRPPPPAALAVCHLCGNSFKGNSKLNRHLRDVCEKNKIEEQMSALFE